MIRYLRLIKFSHTIFSLPFALVGYFEGVRKTGEFSSTNFLLTLLALILARTAAMAFNRWLDRDVDALNPRTQSREIPSGRVRASEAFIITMVSSLLFVVVTYFINKLAFALSPVALFIILGYSFTKRFTIWSHFILGLALSIAPMGGFIASSGEIEPYMLWLVLSVIFWVAGFDIIYAMQDEEFDRRMGLFSIPARFGKRAQVISFVSHLVALFLLTYFCLIINHFWVWVGFALFSLMVFLQHLFIWAGFNEKIHLNFGLWNGMASVLYGMGYLLYYLVS